MPANVTIRTNAGDVMNALSVKANTIRDNMDKSAEKIAKMALQEAKRLSSGSMSYKTMAKRGYPYSRKNPTTSTPWKINKHEGDFYRGWTTQRVGRRGRGDFAHQLINPIFAQRHGAGRIAYADIIGQQESASGTGYMTNRPIVPKILDNIRGRAEQEAKRGLEQALHAGKARGRSAGRFYIGQGATVSSSIWPELKEEEWTPHGLAEGTEISY